MLLAALALLSAALVPAPREFVGLPGTLSVVAKVSYSEDDWYDFDRVGQCLAEASVSVTRDPSLPPEGYRLEVTPTGVEIAAADTAGELHAHTTLRQLAVATGTNSVAVRCCRVRDWPAYRWRGMLVDEARNFLGKEFVMKILDTMAMHKLNVLHWHLTDDQGWRLEIRRHPELVKYGAVRPRSVKFGTHAAWKPPSRNVSYEFNSDRYGPFFYTREDVREILVYARERGISVVPERDRNSHFKARQEKFKYKAFFPALWPPPSPLVCIRSCIMF